MATSELTKEEYPITLLRASDLTPEENWLSSDVTKRWTDNPQGVSAEYPYEFVCTRYYTYKDNVTSATANTLKKGWQLWNTKNIALWAHYGMNASPYQLLFGNPYESIYAIEASGASREAYVILDGDGVSTGEILLLGGNENSKGTYNIKIDNIYIIDLNNTEHSFNNGDFLTINLGDNWNCRFLLSDNNGNPIINMVGIGPDPTNKIYGAALPDTIELNDSDSCFKCDLGGKYQKKVVIKAVNLLKNVSVTSTWTITAIRDKNGDGIWRYLIMPNIDRVVRSSYYKKTEENKRELVSTVYNIGSANSVIFDIEKDTYGQAWRNITNLDCKVVIKNPNGGVAIEVTSNGGPIVVPFENLISIVDQMADANPTLPQTVQYTVELLVVDPDYEANYDGYSTVDKCNLLFEYLVGEGGKDGKDGKNGATTMFNLSNDSGSFAYNYKNKTIVINSKDNTTNIEYQENALWKSYNIIKVGETIHDKAGTGKYGRVNYSITSNNNYWTLTVNSIDSGEYVSVYKIPIIGYISGREIGSATFKMVGVSDLNGDGAYAYRLVSEHAYSTEDSSNSDYLEVTVYRDALIEGTGYDSTVPIAVLVVSKLEGKILSTSYKEVSCKSPATIDTLVSMATVLENKGVVVKVYTKDADYINRPAMDGNSDYHFTGESEDIAYTVPDVSLEKLDQAISNLDFNSIYNYTGLASRIRSWSASDYYFPVISEVSELNNLQSTFANIASAAKDDLVTINIGGTTYICPRYFDIVYYGTATKDEGTPMYKANKYNHNILPPGTDGEWALAESFDFIKANTAYILSLVADSVLANRILVKNGEKIVAGLINGESAFNDIKEDLNGNVTKSDDIIFFAGLPDGATSLADAAFTVNRDGTTKIGVGSEGGTSSGESGGSSGITEADIKKWNLLTVNGKFLGDVEAKTLKAGNSDNYMKFCTLSEALIESGKEVVIGGSGNIKSDTMVVLIKSGSDFFVLNPLDLAKGSGIDVQSTIEIYERLSLTSSNYYIGTDDVIYEDPNCLNPVKEGTIWYEVTGEAVFGQLDPSDVISEDVGLNVISVMAYKYTEYERTSSGKQKTGRYGYYIPKGWDKYGNPLSGGGFIDMVLFITGNYGKLNRYTYKNVTYNRTIYYILPRAIYYGSGTVSTYELTSAEEMIQPDGPEEIIL